MRILLSICLLNFLIACTVHKASKFDFLIGTWKMEGKELYEIWEKNKNNELIGQSYKLIKNQKTILETLSIKTKGNEIIFEATVLNQNSGKSIQFILNNEINSYFSFENEKHDFPKKIQYKKITKDEIEIVLRGDNSKEFSYTQLKQKKK